VVAVCNDIVARIQCHPPDLTERQLWWELSCCLLSSQVPYPLARAAADVIAESGLLMHCNGVEERLAANLTRLLSTALQIDGRPRAYRFPNTRGRMLAASRSAVTREAGELGNVLARFTDAERARDWFVRHAPGVGPKQASMFLRNVGVSYDLAVLDRHVLMYMAAVGLAGSTISGFSGMSQYRRHEATLRAHALSLGHPVGLLDWAIWIVMRVARSMCEERFPT
jgi:N-glycosylase/DNA lyase